VEKKELGVEILEESFGVGFHLEAEVVEFIGVHIGSSAFDFMEEVEKVGFGKGIFDRDEGRADGVFEDAGEVGDVLGVEIKEEGLFVEENIWRAEGRVGGGRKRKRNVRENVLLFEDEVEFAENIGDVGRSEGLDDIRVHASLEGLILSLFEGVGSDGDDDGRRERVGEFVFTDEFGGGVAVDFGHLEIKEEEIGVLGLEGGEGFGAIFSDIDKGEAVPFEDGLEDDDVDFRVLSDEESAGFFGNDFFFWSRNVCEEIFWRELWRAERKMGF